VFKLRWLLTGTAATHPLARFVKEGLLKRQSPDLSAFRHNLPTESAESTFRFLVSDVPAEFVALAFALFAFGYGGTVVNIRSR
jgi:hypothetical protein